MTQNEMILRYMKEFGSITPWEAMREFGCMRLGARIYDLKRDGVGIIKKTITNKNRFGKTVRFAQYSLG